MASVVHLGRRQIHAPLPHSLSLLLLSLLLLFSSSSSFFGHVQASGRAHLQYHAGDEEEEGGGSGGVLEMSVELPTMAATLNRSANLWVDRAARAEAAESSCEASYGVLPCSSTAVGNLFLMLVYGFLMLKAAMLLSDGSELLLSILGPGLIGGLLLPILGALPDSLLILVSGIGGTQAEAQEQVLVGIGLLAGSTVMLLTILWGTCLTLGRCDLESTLGRKFAKDKKLNNGWSLTETGVTTDYLTRFSSYLMLPTVIPYIVAQLPSMFGFSTHGNIPVLVACIISVVFLAAYCIYQVFSPWIQKRRILLAENHLRHTILLQKFHKGSKNEIINAQGKPNHRAIENFFESLDVNHDGYLSLKELDLVFRVTLDKYSIQSGTDALHILKEFDSTGDGVISKTEFSTGMCKWVESLKMHESRTLDDANQDAQGEYFELTKDDDDDDDDDEENNGGRKTKSQIVRMAVLYLMSGTLLAAVVADPLVDAVNAFSTATNIPSFFISFVVLPLASNSSEAVSSLVFASRKKKKNISLTYSQIYGAVTVNNTMGLGIFLAVVYLRQLVWDFSSEVLVIVLVIFGMGFVAGSKTTFPFWTSFIAFALYPLSLGLVAVLDYVFGWE